MDYIRQWNTIIHKSLLWLYSNFSSERILELWIEEYKWKPYYIQFVLGKRCNLKCSYCHVDAWLHHPFIIDKTLIYYKSLAILLEEKWIKNLLIEFQWWEPLLYKDLIKDIIDYYKTKFNLTIILTTNWTLYNEDIVNLIKENNIHLNISFDWNIEIHNKNRTNSAELVLENIKKYQSKIENITYIGTLNESFLSVPAQEVVKFLEKNHLFPYLLRPVLEIWRGNNASYEELYKYYQDFKRELWLLWKVDSLTYHIVNYLWNKQSIIEFDIFQNYKTLAMDSFGNLFFSDYERSLKEISELNVMKIFDLNEIYDNKKVKEEIDLFYQKNKERLLPLPLYMLKNPEVVNFYDNIVKDILNNKNQ